MWPLTLGWDFIKTSFLVYVLIGWDIQAETWGTLEVHKEKARDKCTVRAPGAVA